jgi:hypothetical protein
VALITLPILQFEATVFEQALTEYNHSQAAVQASLRAVNVPHKSRSIALISKEKSEYWDEKSTVNSYDYTLRYPFAAALFGFAEYVGVCKAVAKGQYGREVPPGA